MASKYMFFAVIDSNKEIRKKIINSLRSMFNDCWYNELSDRGSKKAFNAGKFVVDL